VTLAASCTMASVSNALKWLDARMNVKSVYRRLQIAAKFLILGTFVDDSLRVLFDYSGQISTMGSVGIGRPLAAILPAVFILTQGVSVGLILLEFHPEAGCTALLIWTGLHPFIYKQQKNLEFLLESVTIMGGLMVLLSSERKTRKDHERNSCGSELGGLLLSANDAAEEKDLLQLFGRCCISAVFLFYGGKMMHERVQSFSGLSMEDPTAAVFEGVLLVFLLVLTGLLVAGMKSRWCALLLALIMGVSAMYKHPWYITMWSKSTFALDFVVGYEDVKVDAWLYSDHQRYFFFQQLSTVGALLQLVVHGPGKYSMDEADGPVEVIAMTTKGTD